MLRRPADNQLPPIWQAAWERDRTADNLGADPLPERRVARLLAAFVLTGLAFLVLPGTLLGVWNLISISQHRAVSAASTAWIQAHGQAQLFGWVATFILGISLYTLPKFRGRMLDRLTLAWTCWGAWTLGLAWRWYVGVYGGAWRIGLAGSAVLEFAAALLAGYLISRPSFHDRRREPRPKDLGSWLGIAGMGALLAALALNVGISVRLALYGENPVYPPAADRAFLLVALWGFAVPMAWGYSTRFVTIFLALPEPVHRLAAWMAAGIGALSVFAIAGWFRAADAVALALTVVATYALRVFLPAIRQPKLNGVYRGYPAFVRLSYGWLIAGAALGVLADLLPAQTGLGGASRHAVTVGFLATLIFAIGPRILPSFLNSRELYSPRLMAVALWALNLGCLLRVASESFAYGRVVGDAAWALLPVSAMFELAAVIVFALNIAASMAQRVPAWFYPRTVGTGSSVYWFVSSYPGTRQLLINAGLATLARQREVPRSLTLAEAAEADGANVELIVEQLRAFVVSRQPHTVRQKQTA